MPPHKSVQYLRSEDEGDDVRDFKASYHRYVTDNFYIVRNMAHVPSRRIREDTVWLDPKCLAYSDIERICIVTACDNSNFPGSAASAPPSR